MPNLQARRPYSSVHPRARESGFNQSVGRSTIRLGSSCSRPRTAASKSYAQRRHRHRSDKQQQVQVPAQNCFKKESRLKSNGQFLEILQRICGTRVLESSFPGYNVENICRQTLKNHSLANSRIMYRQMIKDNIKSAVQGWDQQNAAIKVVPHRKVKFQSQLQANYVPSSYHGDSVLFHSKKEIRAMRRLIVPQRIRHSSLWQIQRNQDCKRLMKAYEGTARQMLEQKAVSPFSQNQLQFNERYISSHEQLYDTVKKFVEG